MPSGTPRVPGPAAALLELDDPRRGRLVVHSGETVVLLGPSGAGKTALIRTLLGLEGRGSEPVLAVRGRPASTRQLAAMVGWVPEGDGVFLSDTVWDNVARPPSVPPIDPALARDALDLVGLAARAVEPVANLPRQARRRVALARALAIEPRMLLLDEPFEGVAPVLARRLAEVIAGLRQTGLSAILSESSLAHAHGLLDRVFVIDRGAVAEKT